MVIQMRCVNIMLKAGAAMTERQLTVVINALPTLEDPTVIGPLHSFPASYNIAFKVPIHGILW